MQLSIMESDVLNAVIPFTARQSADN